MTPNESHIAELSRRNLDTNFENWKASWRNRKMSTLFDHVQTVSHYVIECDTCDAATESLAGAGTTAQYATQMGFTVTNGDDVLCRQCSENLRLDLITAECAAVNKGDEAALAAAQDAYSELEGK